MFPSEGGHDNGIDQAPCLWLPRHFLQLALQSILQGSLRGSRVALHEFLDLCGPLGQQQHLVADANLAGRHIRMLAGSLGKLSIYIYIYIYIYLQITAANAK